MKDLNLKVFDKKIEIVIRETWYFKRKENNLTELQEKYDNLLTKVEEMTSKLLEKEQSSEFKCDKCELIAKNDAGLKVHNRSKHTKTKINVGNVTLPVQPKVILQLTMTNTTILIGYP